jgi:hypothetical protein
MLLTGSFVCHMLVRKPPCAAEQVTGLYVGLSGWQTAPGGTVLIKRPDKLELSAAQAAVLGQSGELGVALQRDWAGEEHAVATLSNWTAKVHIVAGLRFLQYHIVEI